MINVRMQPTENRKFSPKIAVAAVGGAGGNAVDNMIHAGMQGVDFIVCNTDAQALDASLADTRIQLGSDVTKGLGAGARPDVGRMAAEESLEEVLAHLENANMVFVTAGMGGGTGTGAAPVIARACRERDILTVGVVTKPFHFEGTMRMKAAEEGIRELQEYVDTLIVIPNQNLFRIANEKTTFAEAFKMADSVLQSGVRGVTDLIVNPGLINLDFADIRSIMLEMGKAVMGTGEATGDKRAIEAAEKAISNPLLDDMSMKGAKGVIINVTGGEDMTLFEADEACNRIRDEVDPDANIIFGTSFDANMEGVMRVSVVATGIDKEVARKTYSGTNPSVLNRAKPRTTATQQPVRQQVTAASGYAPGLTQTQVVSGMQPVQKPVEEVQESVTETPSDLFEAQASQVEQEYAPQQTPDQPYVQQQPEQEVVQATGTTGSLRGSTYGESFIPPAPATSANFAQTSDAGQSYASLSAAPQGGQTGTQTEATAQTEKAATSLNLRPPGPGASKPVKKQSQSLFERITSGFKHDDEDDFGTQNRISAETTEVSDTAAQGKLNIESASKPASSVEDELDIPAFLRRQTN